MVILAGEIRCSRAPMVAGPSERKKACWLEGLPWSMAMTSLRKVPTGSLSEGEDSSH